MPCSSWSRRVAVHTRPNKSRARDGRRHLQDGRGACAVSSGRASSRMATGCAAMSRLTSRLSVVAEAWPIVGEQDSGGRSGRAPQGAGPVPGVARSAGGRGPGVPSSPRPHAVRRARDSTNRGRSGLRMAMSLRRFPRAIPGVAGFDPRHMTSSVRPHVRERTTQDEVSQFPGSIRTVPTPKPS